MIICILRKSFSVSNFPISSFLIDQIGKFSTTQQIFRFPKSSFEANVHLTFHKFKDNFSPRPAFSVWIFPSFSTSRFLLCSKFSFENFHCQIFCLSSEHRSLPMMNLLSVSWLARKKKTEKIKIRLGKVFPHSGYLHVRHRDRLMSILHNFQLNAIA